MQAAHNVIALHQRKPKLALEHLKRLTGLGFSSWPESLLAYCIDTPRLTDEGEPEQLRKA